MKKYTCSMCTGINEDLLEVCQTLFHKSFPEEVDPEIQKDTGIQNDDTTCQRAMRVIGMAIDGKGHGQQRKSFWSEKMTLKLSYPTILIIMCVSLAISVMGLINSCKARLPFNQPFILYLEKVSPQAILACERDENCMDVLPIGDLPKRGDIK